jgi:hypothetical protein
MELMASASSRVNLLVAEKTISIACIPSLCGHLLRSCSCQRVLLKKKKTSSAERINQKALFVKQTHGHFRTHNEKTSFIYLPRKRDEQQVINHWYYTILANSTSVYATLDYLYEVSHTDYSACTESNIYCTRHSQSNWKLLRLIAITICSKRYILCTVTYMGIILCLFSNVCCSLV